MSYECGPLKNDWKLKWRLIGIEPALLGKIEMIECDGRQAAGKSGNRRWGSCISVVPCITHFNRSIGFYIENNSAHSLRL